MVKIIVTYSYITHPAVQPFHKKTGADRLINQPTPECKVIHKM